MNTYQLIMSPTEVKPITIQVVDLIDAETVSSANATHTPPDDGMPLTISPTVETPYVNLFLGPFGTPGQHFVKVQAVGSIGSKPEVLYSIEVKDF